MVLRALPIALAVTFAACGDDPIEADSAAEVEVAVETDAPPPEVTADAEVTPEAAETSAEVTPEVTPEVDDSPLGGDRPARLILPAGYVPGALRPLVILLHGFSVTGEVQDLYLGLSPEAAAKGFITLVPDGTKNATGVPFWNASPSWCCDFGNSGVDDAGYILGLVAEAKTRFTIDPARVYLVGHSNGGFMSYKLACEHADVFAGIASIAGSMALEPEDCDPSEPVSVLQVHGTADATIAFAGALGQYPSAETVVKRWAEHDGCELLPQAGAVVDYDTAVLGAEAEPQRFPGCTAGTAVELWKMSGSSHIPTFAANFMPSLLDWLLAHPKVAP